METVDRRIAGNLVSLAPGYARFCVTSYLSGPHHPVDNDTNSRTLQFGKGAPALNVSAHSFGPHSGHGLLPGKEYTAMNYRAYIAEAIGTFWLTFGGCGSAVIAAGFPHVGIGLLGVAIAFGLTVVTMAYAVGHISGCHLNPAVTVGLTAGGRFPAGEVFPYIIAQVIGAIVAALLLYAIAKGAPGFDLSKGFATNGYGEHSPGHYDLLSALLMEVVMTMLFLFVIMGSTHGRAPVGFAPLAIGLCLTLIHLVSIPVTNTSVNPARSTGPALIEGGIALSQLWLFWIAPLVGGVLGGVIYRWLSPEPRGQVTGTGA
jgi:aquaporin Z